MVLQKYSVWNQHESFLLSISHQLEELQGPTAEQDNNGKAAQSLNSGAKDGPHQKHPKRLSYYKN